MTRRERVEETGDRSPGTGFGSGSSPATGDRRPASVPEIVVLHEMGDVWKELRVALPSGLRSGDFEFPSPGLCPYGWILSLLGSKATLRRVGTLGACWAEFEPEDRVQLWIPGAVEIPEGVVVQVSFAESA